MAKKQKEIKLNERQVAVLGGYFQARAEIDQKIRELVEMVAAAVGLDKYEVRAREDGVYLIPTED